MTRPLLPTLLLIFALAGCVARHVAGMGLKIQLICYYKIGIISKMI